MGQELVTAQHKVARGAKGPGFFHRRFLTLTFVVGVVVGGSLLIGALMLYALPDDHWARQSLISAVQAGRNYLVVNPPWRGPSVSWERAAPESVGLDSVRLDVLHQGLADRDTEALVIIKGNRVAYEWYESGKGPNTRFAVGSMPKALVGSMALLAAVDDGLMGVDDPAWKYIPEWEDDPVRSAITIRHLASHSSGMADIVLGGDAEYTGGWEEEYVANPGRRFDLALTVVPIEFEPGTRYSYSGVGYHALAYAIVTSLRGQPEDTVGTFLQTRVMAPLGLSESDWDMSYGEEYAVDGMMLQAIGAGARFTPRAVARIGQLMLNRGQWEGRRIISPELVDSAVAYEHMPVPARLSGEPEPAAGMGWWTNFDGVWPSVPRDAFISVGAYHQVLLVVPSQDLVVVRLGGSLGETHWGEGFWKELEQYFLNSLMEAIHG